MDFQYTTEQKMLIDTCNEIGKKEFEPRAAYWDKNCVYPWTNVYKLNELGILGMTIPEDYGGQGRHLIDAIIAIETIAQYCGVTARIIVETNMGAVGNIMAYGTEKQKRMVASRILEEGDKPTIAMTEPEAGTALTELRTTAEKKGDSYILNGTKHWITGGSIAKTNFVWARFIEDGQDNGIGGILVDSGTPGFEFGKIEDALGVRGIPEAELIFTNCEVPAENVVVRGNGHDSFRKMMYGYNGQRVGASAVALGIAQGAHNLAVDWMNRRQAFGHAISEYQGLQWMMAEAEMELWASRLLIYQAACNAREASGNMKLPTIRESSMAKAYSSKKAFHIVSDSLQMFGGYGYSKDLPLERMLRDVRMFQLGGGTTQAQLNMIARSVFKRKFEQK